MSGGETIERHAVERKLIGSEIGVEKLVWGSDCGGADCNPCDAGKICALGTDCVDTMSWWRLATDRNMSAS